MNLMQVERIKSKLKRQSYCLNKSSGKTINNRKRIFEVNRTKYAFKRRRHNLLNTQWTVGSIIEKRRGPFERNQGWQVEI